MLSHDGEPCISFPGRQQCLAATFSALMQLFPSRIWLHPITLQLITSQWCWRCLWPAVSWDSRGRGSGVWGGGGGLKWPIESPGQVGALVGWLGRLKTLYCCGQWRSWKTKDESFCSWKPSVFFFFSKRAQLGVPWRSTAQFFGLSFIRCGSSAAVQDDKAGSKSWRGFSNLPWSPCFGATAAAAAQLRPVQRRRQRHTTFVSLFPQWLPDNAAIGYEIILITLYCPVLCEIYLSTRTGSLLQNEQQIFPIRD